MRLLLIDDHTLFRIGLAELLERRGISVLAALGDGATGIEQAIRSQPDLILLDLRMPYQSGIEVLRGLRARGQHMPVVMLTTSREEEDLIASLQQGAQGYLLKDMEPDDLIAALHQILAGETVVAPELTGALARAVRGVTPGRGPHLFADLTPREREILCLLADGLSNKLIGRQLSISDGTVKLHVKAILRKLNIHSRVEAAVLAVERNLCPRPPGGATMVAEPVQPRRKSES